MWFILATAAAVSFGVRGILYQWTSQRPVDRNMLLLGVYLSGTLVSFLINLYMKQPWSVGVWMGVPMGLFSFIANAAMYRGFAVGKASVIAMFTGFPPVVVVIFAYFLWGESLDAIQWIGFILIIVALLIIRYDQDFRKGLLTGLKWGLITMFFFGFTDLSSKQATLLDAATLPALTMMYGTGSLLFACLYLWSARGVGSVGSAGSAGLSRNSNSTSSVGSAGLSRNSNSTSSVGSAGLSRNVEGSGETVGQRLSDINTIDRQWANHRTFAWGLFVGISNIAGMILLLSAFRLGTTGIVSAISAMNVVIVLLYARLYLKEPMSRRVIIGLILALVGIVVVKLAT